VGKKFFHNIIEGSKVKAEPFYSAIITPVIHYCMGALEIDVTPQLLPSLAKPFLAFMLLVRWQVFMATIVWVATPFWAAWFLAWKALRKVHAG